MKQQYDKISRDFAQRVLSTYSTSFSLGTRIFPSKTRTAISSIYGYVRLADEIVDTFHSYPQSTLLEEFTEQTFLAIERGISTNPVLNAYQEVVNVYSIDEEHIHAFLSSMKTDLSVRDHNNQSYNTYIYGSAEAVGLMCLHVFVDGDQEKFNKLQEPAKMLGSAFQKVNFLRDIKEDNKVLNRQYFPDLHQKNQIDENTKKQIEAEIKEEFNIAYEGIKKLKGRRRLAVWVAYVYYRGLLTKISKVSSDDLMSKRIRISNPMKFFLLFQTTIRYYLKLE